eukprot:425406-Prymnesium_polylepis.1
MMTDAASQGAAALRAFNRSRSPEPLELARGELEIALSRVSVRGGSNLTTTRRVDTSGRHVG